jgi:serine phosphatase RsbU (regulator of sigma subunit)/PAS domain-containing protein
MPQGDWLEGAAADIAARRDALRQAAGLPGADPRMLIDAAFTELDAAIEALAAGAARAGAAGAGELAVDARPEEARAEAVRAERRLLHAVFQQAPAPLLLLEQDGTIRRANNRAAALLGAPAGYATGKPLTAFLDLPFRAAVATLLAAVGRTGEPRTTGCRVLTPDGPVEVALTAAATTLPGSPPTLIVTALPVVAGSGPAAPAAAVGRGGARAGARKKQPAEPDSAVVAMTRRLDAVTALTRVLLDNSTFSEAVTLQRCARLLAGEIADWVIIDIDRGGRLLRQFAVGPRGGKGGRQADQVARAARAVNPDPESLPAVVHSTGKSVLHAHLDEAGLLGRGPGGTPLVMTLGATSVMCVPISDGATSYGALTLTRLAGSGPFDVADLGLAEELGRHLAIAVRVDRVFRQRSQAAEALQASLLPSRLPRVAGLEFAAAYVGATQFQEISGDFYDVFAAGDGWGIVIGDVCGKGQEAAAMTAAARHAIRALAYVHETPDAVLGAANEVLVSQDYEDRFVTAALAFLRQREDCVQVQLGSSGHPGPAVVRADGRVEILEGEGLPLGLFADATTSRTDLELGPGDVLFFYTDGVTEARGADRAFFEERLADALAAMAGQEAAEIVRAVQEMVTSFSSGELKDDVTILAVRVGSADDARHGSS